MSLLHVTPFHNGTGAGTLVLLHGFPVDSRSWEKLAKLINPSWKVLGVDLPGLGKSSQVLPQPPSMEASAHAVIAAIQPHLAPDSSVVIGGLSMGGYVLQAILQHYPDICDGVIFFDTRANADNSETITNRLNMAKEAAATNTPELVMSMASGTLSSENAQQRPELVAFMESIISTQTGIGVAWSQQAMAARPDATTVLQKTSAPALGIVGEQDHVSPLEAMLGITNALPNATLVTIPDAGHMSPIENPAAVATAVNNFLAQYSL